MADEANTGVRAERGSRTWLWMILALVVVGAFLTWLGMASEPTSVAIVEDETDETGEAVDAGVPMVPKDTLAADKSAYEGQRIRVAGVEATGTLGPGVFWGELGDRANQVPILIRLDSAVVEGWEMQEGAMYTLTGVVERMTDSVATAWAAAGEFAGEGEQVQATFADYFIHTTRIRPTRGGPPGEAAPESGGG